VFERFSDREDDPGEDRLPRVRIRAVYQDGRLVERKRESTVESQAEEAERYRRAEEQEL
jgi:hypothetical protein